MKRVVCGVADGIGTVFLAQEPTQRDLPGDRGIVSQEIWATAGAPTTAAGDIACELAVNARLDPGETRFRVVTFPAGYTSQLHRTRTIDYGVILKGRIEVEMADGSIQMLEEGDCVVQLGGMHIWRTPAASSATIAFVMVGADRPEA